MFDFNNTITPVENNNGFDIYHYDEMESTADIVKQPFFQELNNPFIVMTNSQTKSRGRLNNKWKSLDGNLFANLVMPITGEKGRYSQMSFVMALVVSDVVSELTSNPDAVKVKWPNDILVADAKICGVLIEMIGDKISIGFGVNVKQSPILEGANYTTTSLIACDVNVEKEQVLNMIIERFNEWYRLWNEKGFDVIVSMWKNRAKGIGENITVRQINSTMYGLFKDVDDMGNIILETNNGIETVNAGEVVFG